MPSTVRHFSPLAYARTEFDEYSIFTCAEAGYARAAGDAVNTITSGHEIILDVAIYKRRVISIFYELLFDDNASVALPEITCVLRCIVVTIKMTRLHTNF